VGISGYAPAFIREGAIIHVQNSLDISGIKDLDNIFILLCVFKFTESDEIYKA
jgi:hypothetical protein